MSSITKLNKNLMVSPICTSCDYCSGCEIRNPDSDTQASCFNDIITSYFCTNPKMCGPGKKEVNVNIRSKCPFEHQSDGWAFNSRMKLIDENAKLKHMSNCLICDNNALKNTISEKEKTIKRFSEAARLAVTTCSTLFLAAANGILETDDEAENAKPASSAKPKEENK